MHSNVSRLRKALAPDLDITARAPGYVLDGPTADGFDAAQFELLVADATAARSPGATVALLERARLRCGGVRPSTSSPTWSGRAARRSGWKSSGLNRASSSSSRRDSPSGSPAPSSVSSSGW